MARGWAVPGMHGPVSRPVGSCGGNRCCAADAVAGRAADRAAIRRVGAGMTAGGPMDIVAIAALLAELLPAGIREGAEWRIGSVAGEPGRSMGVHLGGAKAGVWYDWAAGSG